MTLNDLIDYYAGLLIVQYQAQPAARAVIALLSGEALADLIIQQTQDAFNLDTARGKQLDTLAQFRGVQRRVFGPNLNKKYFGMPGYAVPTLAVGGMNGYELSQNGLFFYCYTDSNSVVYTMTDDELRSMLEFKAIADNTKPTNLAEIDNLLTFYFTPYYGFADNANMTVTFIEPLVDTDTIFALAFSAGYLPRPAGVAYSIVRASTPGALFDMPSYADPTPAGAFGFANYSTLGGGSILEYA